MKRIAFLLFEVSKIYMHQNRFEVEQSNAYKEKQNQKSEENADEYPIFG